MRRHLIEKSFNLHRGQLYGGGFGRSYESEHDAELGMDRDTPERWSDKADWNNDINQNTRDPKMYGESSEEPKDYYGLGPKNYRLKDDYVYEDVCQALYEDPLVDATEIEVKVKSGIVFLSGLVNSRHEKKCAENAIDKVRGVKDVFNGLTFPV